MARPRKVWDETLDAKIEDEAIRETEDPTWGPEAAMKRLLPQMPPSETYDMVLRRLKFHRDLIREEDAAYRRHQAAMKMYVRVRPTGKRARPQEKDV